MDNTKKYAITISRQIGSGGAYIGRQLAQKLNFYYADRDILSKAAKEFSVVEKDLLQREEKLQSFWDSYFQIRSYGTDAYLNSLLLQPTSYELFTIESEIIRRIMQEQSAVIIGRCGFHILREYPYRVSIFLHAEKDHRIKRVQGLYQISEKEAVDMVNRVDKERTHFVEQYTKTKWADARHFDLTLNTGKFGLDNCVDAIMNYLSTI